MAEEAAQEPTEKVSLIKKLIVPLAAVVVTTGVALGALNFFGVISFGGSDPAAAAEASGEGGETAEVESSDSAGEPAYFFSFYPDMLVNFTADGRAHYLKVSIDVMARDEGVIKGVEEYHSILRNNILKLFQQVKYETVKGHEGMESMQQIALEEIKRVLKIYHGENDVEGVYFTSFVVQ